MPSDSNGVYSLPTGYLATTGETIQASQHNPPLEDIASAISARMMRSGAAPMTGPLPVVDGSVGNPAIKFGTADTTGFYKTTNGIGVAVNGVKVVEFTSGGVSRMLGELIPITLTAAQPLTVLPYGQTLLRSAYPALWTVAQAEIALGNASYNNGDGATTFGILDARGRIPAAWDKMGGTVSGRLTTVGSGIDGSTIGSVGGTQSVSLLASHLAPHTHSGTTGVSNQSLNHRHTTECAVIIGSGQPGGQPNELAGLGSVDSNAVDLTGHNHNFTTDGGTGLSGAPHLNTQPTFVCNFLLFAGA